MTHILGHVDPFPPIVPISPGGIQDPGFPEPFNDPTVGGRTDPLGALKTSRVEEPLGGGPRFDQDTFIRFLTGLLQNPQGFGQNVLSQLTSTFQGNLAQQSEATRTAGIEQLAAGGFSDPRIQELLRQRSERAQLGELGQFKSDLAARDVALKEQQAGRAQAGIQNILGLEQGALESERGFELAIFDLFAGLDPTQFRALANLLNESGVDLSSIFPEGIPEGVGEDRNAQISTALSDIVGAIVVGGKVNNVFVRDFTFDQRQAFQNDIASRFSALGFGDVRVNLSGTVITVTDLEGNPITTFDVAGG